MTDHHVLTASDVLDVDRVRTIAGLLDRDPATLAVGERLPLWHTCFFLPRPAQSEIGPDGHPRVGLPTPPGPGLRQMFAGGRVEVGPGLDVGAAASAAPPSSEPSDGKAALNYRAQRGHGQSHEAARLTSQQPHRNPLQLMETVVDGLATPPNPDACAARRAPSSASSTRRGGCLRPHPGQRVRRRGHSPR